MAGCRGGASQNQIVTQSRSPVPKGAPGSVFFSFRPLPIRKHGQDKVLYLFATYGAQGKKTQFRLRLSLPPPKGDAPLAFTTGTFYRVPGSDPWPLLKVLATAMEAKRIARPKRRLNQLSFTAALLGQNLSRGVGKGQSVGGFTSEPRGGWIATKVFVADDEGEFFLNLNPDTGQGEFSIKDPDYGDVVVRELGKVL